MENMLFAFSSVAPMAQWQDKARVNSYLYTTRAVHYELLFCLLLVIYFE